MAVRIHRFGALRTLSVPSTLSNASTSGSIAPLQGSIQVILKRPRYCALQHECDSKGDKNKGQFSHNVKKKWADTAHASL
jgi:hypothetical protein